MSHFERVVEKIQTDEENGDEEMEGKQTPQNVKFCNVKKTTVQTRRPQISLLS